MMEGANEPNPGRQGSGLVEGLGDVVDAHGPTPQQHIYS